MKTRILRSAKSIRLSLLTVLVTYIPLSSHYFSFDDVVMEDLDHLRPSLNYLASIENITTYEVNTHDDFDDGFCDEEHCSLREAILASNQDGTGSCITFDLERIENDTIGIRTFLPCIEEGYTNIDGGVGITIAFFDNQRDYDGIEIKASHIQISNVHFRGFFTAVKSESTIQDIEITDCYFTSCIIGVSLQGINSSNIRIDHCILGRDANNNVGDPIADGIYLRDASNSIVSNNILLNCERAIILDNTFGVRLLRNIFDCNFYESIEFENSANTLKKAPEIVSVSPQAIVGKAMPGDTVEIFRDAECVESNVCQGKLYMGTIVAADDSTWLLSAPFNFFISEGQKVTALATDPVGNTSRFSQCETVIQNSNCFSAINLPMNYNCERNSVRTELNPGVGGSLPTPEGFCGESFRGLDVWYKTTVPGSGNLFIKQEPATTIRPVIEVYQGACNALSAIGCNQIAASPYTFLLSGLEPNSEIYIRVWDENNSVVDSTNNAILELTANFLEEDSTRWSICLEEEQVSPTSFVLQYDSTATSSDIQRVTDTLIAKGATLVKQCGCESNPIQLWGTRNPIDLEEKRLVARTRGEVDTTIYNIIIGEIPCTFEIPGGLGNPYVNTSNIYLESVGTEENMEKGLKYYNLELIGNYHEFLQEFNACFIRNESSWVGVNLWGRGLIPDLDGVLLSGILDVSAIRIDNIDGQDAVAVLTGTFSSGIGNPIYFITGAASIIDNSEDPDADTELGTDFMFLIDDISFFRFPATNCLHTGEIPFLNNFQLQAHTSNPEAEVVKVAVIDSGVEVDNEFLANSFWRNMESDDLDNCIVGDQDGLGQNFINGGAPIDLDEHGTAVNGVIMQNLPDNIKLELMNLKFFEKNKGTIFDAICAIYYAIENDADIINLSWGFRTNTFPDLLYEAIAKAAEHDILVVTSAGNDGKDNDLIGKYPANFNLSNVISVASYENDLKEDSIRLAGYSNFGDSTVHIAAPGYAITTGFNNNVVVLVGTSISTPQVTRAAVVLKGMFPSLTASQIRDCLLYGAKYISALEEKVSSGGILDLEAAIECAASIVTTKEPGSNAERLLIFPNPAQSSFTVSFYLEQSATFRISLYDVTGRVVRDVISAKRYGSGWQRTLVQDVRLVPGLYFIVIEGKEILTKPVLIME